MTIMQATRPAVKATHRTARTADEILLWVIANRQEAKASANPRIGISVDAWHRMSPADRRAVGRRLVALGGPRLGPGVTPYGRFASFIDRCVDGFALPEPTASDVDLSGFAPSFILIDDFRPSRMDELEWMGYEFGNGGSESVAIKGLEADEQAAFDRGFSRGLADLNAERDAYLDALAEEHDRFEEAFGGPAELWAHGELAEAGSLAGHPAHEA